MKYALERLNKLVVITLNPANLPQNFLPGDAKKIQNIAEFEYDEICAKFKSEYFSIKEENQLEMYVQRYQFDIINLADTLVKYIALSNSDEIVRLYKAVLSIMEQLLSNIENYFSQYFNLDAKIPECYKILSYHEFHSNLNILKENADNNLLSKTLVKIILNSYTDYEIQNIKKPITFRQLIYHKQLLGKLINVMNDKEILNKDEGLIYVLTYLNFNHARFFNFLTTRFASELQAIPTVKNKISHLLLRLKFYNQFQTKPQFELNPSTQAVKEICINWLEIEICFFEKQTQPDQIPVGVTKQINKTIPIETSLSVYELSFIIKILIDHGAIKNQSYRNLTQLAAFYFKTKYSENISGESLRTKSYNHNRQTIQKVKDFLIDLHNHINSNFKYCVSVMLLNHAFQEGIQAL